MKSGDDRIKQRSWGSLVALLAPRPERELDAASGDEQPVALATPGARTKPGVLRAGVKYGIVGASGIVVNLAVLYLLHTVLGWGFTRSSALATETAIIWNYLGNELWTFHHRRLALRRLIKFNVAALATLLITVTVATIAERFTTALLAQLLGIVAGSGLNFAVNFLWTWRR